MMTNDELFDQILKNSLKIETSEKFSTNLMAKVSVLAEKRRKQEVFKEKLLLFLPLCIVSILIIVFFASTPSTNIGQNPVFALYVKNLIGLVDAIYFSKTIMTILSITMSISLLLIIDLKLRIKKVAL